MIKRILLMITLLSLMSCNSEEELKVVSERTTKENREKFKAETIQKTILANINKPLSSETEKDWEAAFWASEVLQYKDELLKSKLHEAFNYYENASPSFQRSLIQNVFTLFPNQFDNEIISVLKSTDNSKIFAMCANYLKGRFSSEELNEIIKKKFADHENDPILFMLSEDLNSSMVNNPPIVDLLTHNFGENNFVIYSFQRKNRDYKGIALIKNHEGKFLRTNDGSLFAIPQFARAVTNLPPYITNGNTPQGIFSFQGYAVSSNAFIGPTTNIQLVMPYETDPKKYFKDDKLNVSWNIDLYKNLLPESWENYTQIYEAYYAGKAGRTEIIAHGTTINPEFYKDKIYYPYTPSLGCLTANEIWSDKSGERVQSDQQKLVDALKSINAEKGFFILVEIDDQQKDVDAADILKDILKAEN
ncbi:MAG: hypothetical protein CMF23_16890 [Ignavibacteriae bacterium]|nr:hypothetical protein [Ignavibacteriota bacterium]